MNTPIKTKQELIDTVLEMIKNDVNSGDLTAIEELLTFVPEKYLVGYLPDTPDDHVSVEYQITPTVEDKLLSKLEEIKSDERMSYPTATVFVNAPLALIQQAMSSQMGLIEDVLGLPHTQLPIKK